MIVSVLSLHMLIYLHASSAGGGGNILIIQYSIVIFSPNNIVLMCDGQCHNVFHGTISQLLVKDHVMIYNEN